MSLRLRIDKVIVEISLPPALPRLASCVFISAYSLIGLFMDRGIHAHSSPSTTFGFCIFVFVERLLRASLAPPPLPPSLPGLASASAGFCLTERSSRPRDPPLVEDGIAPPVTEDLCKEEGCGSDHTGIGNDTGWY